MPAVNENSDTKQIPPFSFFGEILDFDRRFGKIENDNSFRLENVPPGEYKIFVELCQILVDKKRPEPTTRVLPNTGRELIVIVPDQKTDEPIDLGTIEIPITSYLH
ncbi:MAG: hypothetical protein LBK82_09765 [Planctomycetaceae bacterium]|nr:hypothetical protein [Planctomycetaceae bacterium]